MAQLHVLSEWHGPGEEYAATRLAAELPDDWHVIAGRQLPDPRGAIDLDLVVVGLNGVHLCEEKSWGPDVVVGEVTWYSNGQARPNALNQCSHAAKVLAGRLRTKVGGWGVAAKQLARGGRAVTAHVVMSADPLVLTGATELGEDTVLRLADAAQVLTRRDTALGGALAPLRPQLMAYLLGLGARPKPHHATQILHYSVLGRPHVEGHVTVFPAANPAGNPVGLYAVPVANAADPEQTRRLATREHDALVALATKERTWRVQDWFDWEGYRVTPVVVDMDGTSLGKLASERRPEPDASGRVPEEIGTAVVHDAFTALATVHGEGIMHRALQLRSVEVTGHNRVRFRDFSRSRLPEALTVAPALDDEHRSAAFLPPGTTLAFYQTRDDVYGLALCLVQWLHGDPSDEPDHDLARQRAAAYPGVGATLARCLAVTPADRLDAAAAAAATGPRPGPPAPRDIGPGTLVGGQFRVQHKLGEGAWAVSWLAVDEEVDKLRVLKHLRPERVSAEQVKAEFLHADAINSAHCARPYRVLPQPEPGVLVQQYIEGPTLKERGDHLRAAGLRFEPEEVRRIAVDVLRGLADAHDQHIYHRDVSPSNVVVRPDGHAVLIDFGLAAATDAAQSAVGSPPFTAPEVWTRRHWSPAADIYSAAATVLTAVLGRYPYRGADVDQRDVVAPSAEDQVHYGRALLATLYEALHLEPAARPGDARALADRIQQARDSEAVAGTRVINPTVDALRGLYRGSGVGNAGNRGLDDLFAQETYVPTVLDSGLLPAILRRDLDVVVLSGNPGDGKTSFLVQVGDALDRAGATGTGDAAGWRKTVDGHTFVAVYDASESHGDLSSDALIRAALDPAAGEHPSRRTVLLAANDGRIVDFFTDHEELYPAVAEQMERQRRAPAGPGSRIVLVDLKRRALALPHGGGLGLDILAAVTEPKRWTACEGCVARATCPIRANAALLRTRGAQNGVWTLLLTSHLRRRRRATVRDVRSALGFLVTGNRSCADVHVEHGRGQDPGAGADRRTADLAFTDGSGDYLVQEWSELDPATLSAPGAARAARSDPTVLPDLSAVDIGVMASLKRRLFFGEWSAPGAEHEVRSYRYLLDYLDALDDPEKARTVLLRGLSRVLAYVGYAGEHVALRDRTFDDPAVRAIVVVKELRAEEFTLRTDTVASAYVESFPDLLVLEHDGSRARLRITLDTAELLLRAAAGEVLGDPASAALRQEIEGFGNQLRLQPAGSVRIVDGAGRSVGATVQGEKIVRVP
ncbi:protein kinase domain-containing protein [Pseudonocardia broussonetiae]|uniref:non-specific serine/threonine protein kinase n=1 Tax=Pseudonocardia broussonetiae TaxID=2736640 RepID=A0A6M6JUP6_9PSEU|nr:protein kinase [Pseudonocardia broussonetiae]QJY49851.1 protein kinase [Pseudonocardia broussonetiae]